MPVLDKILISNFRNIDFQQLEFSPNVNCITGNNGEGKTNLLDAIYYLSMTKSAFAANDKFNFRYGQEEFSLSGTYRMENGLQSRFAIKVAQKGEKKITRDDKAYDKISKHIGTLPVVMVSPSDISLVSDSGEERRKFVNSVLSQMDYAYLNGLQQYMRLLNQRNKMLKGNVTDRDLLEVVDMRLSVLAQPIYEARKQFAEELKPVVSEFYKKISGGQEEVSIAYKSDLEKGRLEDLLRNSFEKDQILKYTSKGIQRDDFLFEMNEYPIRKCGSQGQQKSFLVALKFAQYEIMKKAYGFSPILLLDDIFDKLDFNRISNLISMVASNDFGQIFMTDSNKVRLGGIVDRVTADRAYFDTSAGAFTPLAIDSELSPEEMAEGVTSEGSKGVTREGSDVVTGEKTEEVTSKGVTKEGLDIVTGEEMEGER